MNTKRMENNMAKVNSELTVTMNVGNYQTVRVTAGFEDTVRDDETEIEAFERVEQLVDDRIGVVSGRIRAKFNVDGG